jgi:hypothetical protein
MKKVRNWVGGAAAVLMVLIVLAMLLLKPITGARRAAFGPLENEVLRQIMEIPPAELADNAGNLAESAAPSPPPADELSKSDTASQGQAAAVPDAVSRLSRTLTRDDIIRVFRPGTNPVENVYRSLRDGGKKLKEALSWSAGSTGNGGTAFEIGSAALNRGAIDEARNYFRAALETSVQNEDYFLRQTICGQLAWAEDDPEVAAALLEASCTAARPMDEEFLTYHIQNALALSILTGSDALAEHYYARWDALEPGAKPIVNPLLDRGGSEQIESWLEEHHPDFYETATRWDPMQEQVEPGVKSIG